MTTGGHSTSFPGVIVVSCTILSLPVVTFGGNTFPQYAAASCGWSWKNFNALTRCFCVVLQEAKKLAIIASIISLVKWFILFSLCGNVNNGAPHLGNANNK